ncbi:glycosyltransferase family 4 protein [Paenibacillus sp. R14(2021)]|uniref:glycosyltransferase family 4 protein n=1 Tax=Paenibacillus sp. R14(2021) TaxID=2859228 RepID=UPI001C6149C0|nr:glycosyltransferase family 4 protein [Paenibacillus sp. R14(2021)]
MKIITVANSEHVKGGIDAVIKSLLEGLRHSDEHIISTRFPSYIDSVGPLMRIAYSLMSMFKFVFISTPYEIVHLHSAAKGSFYRKSIYTVLSKLLRKKLVFHIHASGFETFQQSNSFNAWIVRRTLNCADHIIVLSDQMKALVHHFCENDRITVLPNPVTIPAAKEVASLRTAHAKVQLLFLGEIGPRKGIYDLVDAIEMLPEACKSRIQLHVCGNNEIERLKTIVSAKKLNDIITVHGWTSGEQKKKQLSNADVFILPSYAEGLPISILEAMAYGLPVISTNVGGIPEIVRSGQNGMLLEPGQPAALAQAIEALVMDEDSRNAYGKKSKEIVHPHDINLVIDQLLTIYRHLSAASRS